MRSHWGTIESLAVLAFAFAVHAGCSSDSSTGGGGTPGADAGAAADSGSSGTDGATPSDAASSTDAPTEAGGAKKFGEPCATDAECESNACFIGGSQSYCSLHCSPQGSPSPECPSPPTSGQCNNQGYCKK